MTKQKKLFVCSAVLSALYLAEFFGLGVLIFGNLFVTSPALPILLAAISMLLPALSVLNVTVFRSGALAVGLICTALAFALGWFLFAAYVLSKLTFLLITGLPVFCVAGIAGVFLFLVAGYPKMGRRGKAISASALAAVLLCVCVFGVLGLAVFRFTSGGAVFAVGDEYQIAWSTSVKSAGSVTVNGVTYYDADNGRNRISTLHKVSVPMSELDRAKSYEINSVPVYSDSAYLSVSGRRHTLRRSFRPVNADDGLQIYNVSDNHECLRGASSAAAYFGDDLDVLILNGDIINDVSSLWQISLIYKLASNVTGGERPVIFTRGNHECNGKYADELPSYVGSDNGKLYYTVTLGNAFFLVLDTNNDMSDDNFLISPSANFEEQRTEQAEWLENLKDFGVGCEYRFLLAHMAFPLVSYERFPEWTERLIAATDGKFDLCVSGHSHLLDYAEAGTGTRTDYPVIRGSHRSNRAEQGEGVDPAAFSGTAIECRDGSITAKFTNAKGRVLGTVRVK